MYFCTIITKQYLSHARVLANSIKAVHPAAEVYVLLADRLDGSFDPAAEPFHTVMLEDLGRAEAIDVMAFYYSSFEFCCALRGFYHDYMWHHTPADSWVFLDSDIYVVGDMSDVFQNLARGSILLNPHNTQPAHREFLRSTDLCALRAGVFNGGFVGIRRCDESARFIAWYSKQLARYCFHMVPGLFVDQVWLNHVPNFFKDVVIYTHPGANLAHWNLYQRTITRDAKGALLCDGRPLMFLHFSGWSIETPGEVSRHSPGYRDLPAEKLAEWKILAQSYRLSLLQNGYADTYQLPYAFDHFDNGVEITGQQRFRVYQEVWSGVQQRVSPFARADELSTIPSEATDQPI